MFVQSYLAFHTCITVIALLFSYIPAFMTCSCSRTVACTLRTYNVLAMLIIIIACKVISGKCIHAIRLAPQCHAFHLVVYAHMSVLVLIAAEIDACNILVLIAAEIDACNVLVLIAAEVDACNVLMNT